MSEKASARFYSGLWRFLVDWFAVPDAPPDLPAVGGERVEHFRPAPGFLRYLKFRFWLGLTAMDIAFFVAWVASFFAGVWLGIALAPVFVVVAILPDVIAYVAIHLQYDTTWYVLSGRSLRIRRGIWVIRETTITFENVQQVKIEQGPLQRYYGIADVKVTTAGGGGGASNQQTGGGGGSPTHVGLLEGVSDASRIRDLIMARVRQSKASGLGDDDHHVAWPASHTRVLREIRDDLAGTGSALALCALITLAGCSSRQPEPPPRTTPEALMAADRAFAVETASRGLDGWMSVYADDAARVRLGIDFTQGLEGIRVADASIFADSTTRLIWEPSDAGVFEDGRHGFTTGRSAFVRIDGDFPDTLRTGRYVTFWRLDDDGRLRVILDTGVND